MKADEKKLDQELTAFTDALLQGTDPAAEPENPRLAATVRMLARHIRPEPPPEGLRRKLRRQVAAEWEGLQEPWAARAQRFFRTYRRQWAWGTVAAMAVLAFVALLLTQSNFIETVGTVIKGTPTPLPPTGESGGLMFIENRGQFDAAAQFQVVGTDRNIWMTQDAIWVTALGPGAPSGVEASEAPQTPTEGVNLKLSFTGANSQARIEPFDRLETRVSYLVGGDPETWQVDVPVWGGVRYVDFYPGADLVITSAADQWDWYLDVRDKKFDFATVNLQVEGAELMALASAPQGAVGSQALQLTTAVGEFTMPLLDAVGMGEVESAPQLEGGRLSQPFAGEPDISPELQATPEPQDATPAASSDLFYGTYLLGSGKDWAYGIAVDAAGAAYVTGGTSSVDFPTTPGAFDVTYNGSAADDVFVVKLHPDGTALEYATFIGGAQQDWANDIAVDAQGNVYLTGGTGSGDFPTTASAFDRVCGSDGQCNLDAYGTPKYDAFVLQLNATGSALLYATFLGGGGSESGASLEIDSAGYVYLAGGTDSVDFPTTADAFAATPGGLYDVFVTKLDPAGAGLTYSTLIGGSSNDNGVGLALGGAGNVYVTGVTFSSNFPITSGAFNKTYGGGAAAFVLKLNPVGTALDYATFLGGTADYGRSIAVDASGAAYVAGNAFSQSFPVTAGAFDTTFDTEDLFTAKLDPNGAQLAYATFLGGSDSEFGLVTVAVDESGYAYVAGATKSANFPTTAGAFYREYNADPTQSDIFVLRLNPHGSALAYSTFLGGANSETSRAIALDPAGFVYVTGYTGSADFPTTPGVWAPQVTANGEYDNAFVVKMQLPPRYAISGQVVDSARHPLSGINVTLNDGRVTVTGADGYYVFDELSAGLYTVSLPEGQNTVRLASAGINVPPDVAEYDFVVLPKPVSKTFAAGAAGQIGYADGDAGATLDIPDGALPVETTLVMTPTVLPDAAEFTFTGEAFELAAYPQNQLDPVFVFAEPVMLTVAYRADEVAPEREDELIVALWTGTGWADAAELCGAATQYVRDVAANRVTVSLCRTGKIALALPQYRIFLPLALRN